LFALALQIFNHMLVGEALIFNCASFREKLSLSLFPTFISPRSAVSVEWALTLFSVAQNNVVYALLDCLFAYQLLSPLFTRLRLLAH